MKKILLLLITSIFLCIYSVWIAADCSGQNWDAKNGSADIAAGIENCIGGSKLVTADWNLNVTDGGGFQQKVNDVIGSISQVILLLAVGSLVYAGYLMVFSGWEEENIKKWKDLIKWTLIGFLWLIFASTIVYLIVNLIYDLA